MSAINTIINRAYKHFVPNAKDSAKLDSVASNVYKYVSDSIAKLSLDAKPFFGGSYAKKTWIKGESDIDIFVVFSSEADMAKLANVVPRGFHEARGTRKYFRGRIKDINVEIVPLLKFKKITDVVNSIDFSILHADYVNRHLTERQRKGVVALKQFCKANDCYGSETYIHGLSGYALELMVMKYGSVEKLFDEVEKWVPGLEILVDGADMSEKITIGSEKPPILLPDPTNPKRNICASLSYENFSKFVFAVKAFLIMPSDRFFAVVDREKYIAERAKRRGTKLFVYRTRVIVPRDMFLSRYNRKLDRLLRDLRSARIDVYSAEAVYKEDYAVLFLEVATFPLARVLKVEGPSVWLKMSDLKNFLASRKSVYVVGDRISYDKEHGIRDFNKFILGKLKEYIATEAVLRN